jgi:hypothetical protein
MDCTTDCQAWAQTHFADADLGDARRTRRLVKLGAAFVAGRCSGGGGTITSVTPDVHQAKAAYRLLDNEQVTHKAVMAGHCRWVRQQMHTPGRYLLIEDSTTATFGGAGRAAHLGPIGESFTRGIWLHSALVVRSEAGDRGGQRQVLGFLGQMLWTRPTNRQRRRKSNGRGKESNHARQKRQERESRKWMSSLRAVEGPDLDTSWVYVADRESDIYEVLLECRQMRCRSVIRAAYPRALSAGAGDGEQTHRDLLTAARNGTVRGTVNLELPKQRRTAKLRIGSATLMLRGPPRPGGRLADLRLNVVSVQEIDAPTGVKPLDWVLLTDLPVQTLEQCLEVIEIYRQRWLVEEYHKALKTGLKLEDSQLSDARRLGALTAVLSIVAVFLLQHKLAARIDPQQRLCQAEVEENLLTVLSKLHPPKSPPTVGWLWTSIAKLGGFQGRRSDGHPGWLTLWRGWQTLMILSRGYELANTS